MSIATRPAKLPHEPAETAVGKAEASILIFGASGDLTARKLIPALFDLWKEGYLSDRSPIDVVQEWGVRKLGQQLAIRTRAGLEKRVLVDFFPAYDEDGGLLLALTPR